MTIGMRVRQVRTQMGLSRPKFGVRVGLSGDTINNIERDRVDIKDHQIILISREYHINEHWLRTGEGEMFCLPLAEEDFIRTMTEIQVSDDDFIKTAIKAYWDLEPSERAVIRKLTHNMLDLQDK